jgi:hypothetical protein
VGFDYKNNRDAGEQNRVLFRWGKPCGTVWRIIAACNSVFT